MAVRTPADAARRNKWWVPACPPRVPRRRLRQVTAYLSRNCTSRRTLRGDTGRCSYPRAQLLCCVACVVRRCEPLSSPRARTREREKGRTRPRSSATTNSAVGQRSDRPRYKHSRVPPHAPYTRYSRTPGRLGLAIARRRGTPLPARWRFPGRRRGLAVALGVVGEVVAALADLAAHPRSLGSRSSRKTRGKPRRRYAPCRSSNLSGASRKWRALAGMPRVVSAPLPHRLLSLAPVRDSGSPQRVLPTLRRDN